MAENERIRYGTSPGNAEIASGAGEVCVSRSSMVARGLSRSAEVLGELDTQAVESEQLPEELQKKLADMQTKFREAFSWESNQIEELRERVLGDDGEVSEELAKGLRELYLAGKLSFLSNNSIEMLDMFTRDGLSAGAIVAKLRTKYPEKSFDDAHVTRRLVTIITQLSTTYEG